MRRGAALIAIATALALIACKPDLHGRCSTTADCRQGAVCALEGVCVAASGSCAPACGLGELCVASSCTAVQPALVIRAPASGAVGPGQPVVTVHVEASSGVQLGALTVTVATTHTVALATVPVARAGDNTVQLGGFVADEAGPASISATLSAAGLDLAAAPVGVLYDAQAPSIDVSIAAPADAISGWVPRSGANILVSALVADGAGSGPKSASLLIVPCPPAGPCAFQGAASPAAQSGAVTYAFPVPRAVQTPGAESPVQFEVHAFDKAGNENVATGALQIDDAPPVFGAVAPVGQGASLGTSGEDGKTWFSGGAGAAPVEIAVQLGDAASGLSQPDVSLHVDAADVAGGTPLDVAPILPSAADGTVHFRLPASGVVNHEGHLRFSIAAKDRLGHASSLAESDTTALWIDDLPPVVTAPVVAYSSAAPDFATVCGQAESATFACGRGPSSAPTHLLRDDQVTVSFDAYDCGSGMANQQQQGFTATSGGRDTAGTISSSSKSGSPCALAGNPTSTNERHHYTFQLRLSEQAAALDPPDASGVTAVQLVGNGVDRVAHAAAGAAGQALVSLVRWSAQVGVATGAPALIPGTPGARQVVVGVAGASPNVIALAPNGAQAWTSGFLPSVQGDLAVGATGLVYGTSGGYSCGTTTHCSTLNIAQAPASPTAVVPVTLTLSGSQLGAPGAIAEPSGGEVALFSATARDDASKNNIFSVSAVRIEDKQTLPVSGDLPGLTAWAGTAFVATSSGFTSVAIKDNKQFDLSTTASFSGASPALSSPPSIALAGAAPAPVPIFGSLAGDQRVRRTIGATCGALSSPCWIADAAFGPVQGTASFSEPVTFDGTKLYAADDAGTIWVIAQNVGSNGSGTTLPPLTAGTVSPPVLLKQGTVTALLVVQHDGKVREVIPGTSDTVLVEVQSLAAVPPAPVVDRRDLRDQQDNVIAHGGVAYIMDGAGWMRALQVDAAPLAASSTAWPRPGRDSCNSRTARPTSGGDACP